MNRLIITGLFSLGLISPNLSASEPLSPGAEIFSYTFKNPTLPEWSKDCSESIGRYTVTNGRLVVEIPPEALGASEKLTIPLPLEKLSRGGFVYVSATIQGENISKIPPLKPWNGVKLGARVRRAQGPDEYPQAKITESNFGPKQIGTLLTLPPDVVAVDLILGLENVSGKVSFSNLRAQIVEDSSLSAKTGPVDSAFKPHYLPRLRGVTVRPNPIYPDPLSADSLRFLAKEWKVNVIRWPIAENGAISYPQGLDTPNLDQVLETELARLDALLPLCRKLGVSVVLNLQTLSYGLFSSVENQDRLAAMWEKIAARYKNEPAVWAYDIANEPKQDNWQPGVRLWNDLASRICRAIRKVDPEKPLIVECILLGQPEGMAYLRPVPVPRVIYSAHMYHPLVYTHQRAGSEKGAIFTYPGTVEGRYWDKAQLEQALAPVIEFQKKYNVPIFIGEFSAIRWAPGAERYLSDCIEIFEKYGWDWCYHGFRSWQGWSVEYGTGWNDSAPAATLTDREKVLRSWFAKNYKPEWAEQK